MVHCITQQQPIGETGVGLHELESLPEDKVIQIIDFLGREVENPDPGVLYLWLYESGFVRKGLAH